MNYLRLQYTVKSLQNLDLSKQYIDRNLRKKTKPSKNTFCQRFKALFAKSKSKEILLAMRALKETLESNKVLISKDQKLNDGITAINESIRAKLVKDKKHCLKNNKQKQELKQLCKDIKNLNTEIESITPSKLDASIQELTTEEELSDFIETELEAFTSEVENEVADGCSESDKNALANEAARIFAELAQKIASNDKEAFLTRENANALFCQMFRIKAVLLNKKDKTDEKDLRSSYNHLSAVLRKHFLQKRLVQAAKDVNAIKKKMFWQSKQVKKIVSSWENDLKKCKVPSIPKYYHCTDSANQILEDPIGIVYHPEKQKGYPGVFASTVPELQYGGFCFALSNQIERKVGNEYPLVTNVNNGISSFFNDKIYIGGKGKKPITRPRLWLGFKQPFTLTRPIKFDDPIGYYEERTLSLMGITGSFQKKSSLDQTILANRKITVLAKGDFKELTNLVHSAIPVILPKDWGKNAKSPHMCYLIPKKKGAGHGEVALEDIPGVEVGLV